MDPPIRVAIYGRRLGCKPVCTMAFISFGPLLLPFALAMSNSLPESARALGYHSVGIKPDGSCMPPAALWGMGLVSNTATALSDAAAAYRYFSSSERARACVAAPG